MHSGPLHIHPQPSYTFLTYSPYWPVHLLLCLKPPLADVFIKSQFVYCRGDVLMSTNKWCECVVLTDIMYIKVNRSHTVSVLQSCKFISLCVLLSHLQCVIVHGNIFPYLCLDSRESVWLLVVTEKKSYTCTFAAVRTSR